MVKLSLGKVCLKTSCANENWIVIETRLICFYFYIPVFGNLLVMSAVLRRKEMRTARNIFIFNLALSDFLLATSIPFTVFDALTRAWPLPYSGIGCR